MLDTLRGGGGGERRKFVTAKFCGKHDQVTDSCPQPIQSCSSGDLNTLLKPNFKDSMVCNRHAI